MADPGSAAYAFLAGPRLSSSDVDVSVDLIPLFKDTVRKTITPENFNSGNVPTPPPGFAFVVQGGAFVVHNGAYVIAPI